ncbi:putative MFS allantoate transporter [Scheffersomyces amazonensis]|uniref:putative MFS allantoate transporter n=1 Tax=Scheffersomyces amazonensis TaxID=1078765 RepID=UPI00315C71F8
MKGSNPGFFENDGGTSEHGSISKDQLFNSHTAEFIRKRSSIYPDISEDEEKKIIRKVDFILVPMLFFTATMGAVDKVSLSTAAIYGFKEDNNLVGQQYSWLGSILFIGSLVGMWPMSYILSKYPLGKVLASASLGWSSFTLLLCACNGFAGLATLRFLMGFLECAIVPGCTLAAGRFYKKKEQGLRLAIIFAFASSVINGFLSWLVGYFKHGALPEWKYLYLLVGSISFLWSCLMLYFLPDSPMNAKFLTDREKYYVVRRSLLNSTSVETNDWKWYQAKEAVLDIKAYLIFLFNVCINIPNGGLSTFSAIIITNLNFDPMRASLMGIPTGVIATLATIFFTWLCSRFENRRCLIAIISLLIPIIGAGIVYGVDRSKVGPQLLGLYLLYFYFAPYVVLISLAQANTAGNTKKSITYSINYLGYCVGALIGPQTFRANQSPKYTGGFIAMLVALCLCIFFSGLYWLVCIWENRNKDLKYNGKIFLEEDGNVEKASDDHIFEDESLFDLTDKEQKHFRYTT